MKFLDSNRIKLTVLVFASFFFANLSIGQNQSEFFKDLPLIDNSTPEWAVLMYDDDPNVKEVIYEYNRFYKKNDFQKNIHTQNYKYWLRYVQDFMDDDGYIKIPSREEQAQQIKQLKQKRNALNKKSVANWTSIGPFETYKNGTVQKVSVHANIYSIDQSLTNSDILIAGAEAGGVFHTTDKGLNWDLISKDEIFVNGITAVKIHPTNNNIFLVSGNRRIYRTTDAGQSWTEVYFLDGSAYEFKYDPTNSNRVLSVGSKGLHESLDGGLTWSSIYSETCWDLEFHPTNSSIVYLLKSNAGAKKTEFYKSIDGAMTFSLISAGWYVPQNPSEASESGGKIGISEDEPNRVYAALIGNSKSGDDGWIGIYRSDDSGDTWSLPSGQIGGPYNSINTMPWNAAAYSSGYHQGFYNFDFVVSPNDADLMWFGTVRLSESSDGATSYISIGAANSQRLSDVHADIQDIEVNGDDIWVASDGGINYSNDDLQSHESRKYNIIGSDFWGFGVGWNEDVYVGGKYHNGNSAYYSNYGVGLTHNVGGVEEATGYINPLFNRHAYFNEYWTGGVRKRSIPDMLGGTSNVLATYSLIPNESYVESSSSGYYFDPLYADHIYAGKDSVIYKSFNGGSSFEPLYDFGVTGNVYGIEMSRSDPNVMYCVWQPGGGYWDWCEIYKTVDGGQTWTKIADPPTNNRWRIEIAISDTDPDRLWVSCNSGENGKKVYETTDGGSTWDNLSSAVLDGEDMKDVFGHTIDGGHIVYVLSATGVFYRKSTTGVWENFSDGLPLVTRGFRLLPFYKENKIRMGTGGRGVWESDLETEAEIQVQIITETDSVFCSRDTTYFDSYSIVNNSSLTYNWSFDPVPVYISSTTVRNPMVVFGQDGSYDVSLTLNDGVNDYTQTIENVVTVLSNCDADNIPGKMLTTANSGDYVQLPSLGINTNIFSIAAWVKPNGIQPDYAGIVMNDGDAGGINFREGNNTLAYHWPGGSWSWDSNLIVPSGEWSHVAMVATPTSMTLYLNGEPAEHITNLSAIDIGTMKIGSYKGWGSRNFSGEIDEVTIWTKSLTQDEVRLNRHLTMENIVNVDPDLIAYYQFNEDTGDVLDRVGLNHGGLAGASGRISSNAPVGGGVSESQIVNSSGIYEYLTPGLSLDFGASHPNDELVVTRINIPPNHEVGPNNEIDKYWIINNYGSNSFAPLNNIGFNEPDSDPGPTTNLTKINLYKRSDNEFMDNWEDLCTASSVGSGPSAYYNFGSMCNIESFSQFALYDNCVYSKYISEVFDPNSNEFKSSANNIDATSLIRSGADIEFDASQELNLNVDFEVEQGAAFRAYIKGCNN